jgi:hypothetical protein
VAVLASVFAAHGGYSGSRAFVAGFTPAVWVAVGLSALGIVAALLTGARRSGRELEPIPMGVIEPAAA